ncbi:DNA polymerase III subunit beta [Oxalobacter paraformigenes]|uniref:Beta sliding clamp n=1 Tax=Oxalobacter paraformigenes TaxID=556268 RepID=C3X5W2_9BURK|nr:DNA polymerase III subunit beta [Oxalobacter paraformigenes]EEO28598.1 DNA polymerase III, beta subunit [Oxalobacter paraformigenes]
MQLVKTGRDNLLRPLQIVSGIVERRHTLPILANILIRKEGNAVSFLSTDTEIQIVTHAEIGTAEEDATTTVAARKLLDILRALPDSAEIAISLNDKRLVVSAGKSRFSLQTLPAADFPTVSQPLEYQTSVTLSQKSLKNLLGMVYFAMAQQDIRYYLNGLLLQTGGNTIKAVATDGHRLAFCQMETEQEFSNNDVIIPRKTILELQRLLEESEEPVRIDISGAQVRFVFGDVELISKLVEGKFPDYTRVIPKGYKNKFTISRELLQRALQRAAIMTSDKFKGIRCILAPGSLKISSTNADQEEAIEEIELDYDGDNIDIGFNVTYLLDVLGNLKNDEISIELGDANSSALMSVPDNTDFKYVVMPMRI